MSERQDYDDAMDDLCGAACRLTTKVTRDLRAQSFHQVNVGALGAGLCLLARRGRQELIDVSTWHDVIRVVGADPDEEVQRALRFLGWVAPNPEDTEPGWTYYP